MINTNRKSGRIISVMIIAIIFVMATTISFASTTKLDKPSITKTSVSGRKITLSYSSVKNAKEYKVYRVRTKTSLKYLKTVSASKKKAYSNPKKYELKKSGSKYKVYRKKTVKTYKLLTTSKKTKASFEGRWNTTYKLVVRAYNDKKKSAYSAVSKVKTEKKPAIETYVFFGSDSRRNDELWKSQNGGKITTDTSGTQGIPRSDVIMLFVVDRAEETIRLVSVYRDTALNESKKGYNFQVANKSYADYGPKEAVKVLERNLDIKISGYASANFKGVADVIDSLGGVTVDIEDQMTTEGDFKKTKLRTVVDTANNYLKEMNRIYGRKTAPLKAGKNQKLKGLQAVAYARVRYTEGGDMQRSVRQRTVLRQMIKRYKKLSNAGKINVILSNDAAIDTDMSLLEFAKLIKSVSGYTIVDSGFPYYKTGYIKTTDQEKGGKSSMLVPCDLKTNVIKLHKKVYGESKYTADTTVRNYSKALKDETGLKYNNRVKAWDNKY